MPSVKKQINVRLSDAGVERLERVVRTMSQALNFAVSQADAIEAALVELERKYPPAASEPAKAEAEPPAAKGKGRNKKG